MEFSRLPKAVVEGLRYRAEDVARSLTSKVVREVSFSRNLAAAQEHLDFAEMQDMWDCCFVPAGPHKRATLGATEFAAPRNPFPGGESKLHLHATVL